MRSAVIIVEHDKVALIERVRDRRTYYVFPGSDLTSARGSYRAVWLARQL